MCFRLFDYDETYIYPIRWICISIVDEHVNVMMEATGMAIVLTFLIAMLLCVITLMVINCLLGMCHTLCKPWMARHCGSGSSSSGSSSSAGTGVAGSYSFPVIKVPPGVACHQHEIMSKGASTFQTIWKYFFFNKRNSDCYSWENWASAFN